MQSLGDEMSVARLLLNDVDGLRELFSGKNLESRKSRLEIIDGLAPLQTGHHASCSHSFHAPESDAQQTPYSIGPMSADRTIMLRLRAKTAAA
jgi:hypothetical protein